MSEQVDRAYNDSLRELGRVWHEIRETESLLHPSRGREKELIYGSAQEFVETRILGCFLKNDEFGLGDRHALCLEQ